MSLSKASYPNIDTLNIEGLRFGFPAEDVLATEERLFDAAQHPFTITGYGNGLTFLQTDGINWQNGIGINDVVAQIISTNPATLTSSNLNLTPVGNAQFQSEDPANSTLAAIDLTPTTSLWRVVAGGQTYSINIDPLAFSTNGLFIDADDGLGVTTRFHQNTAGWFLRGEQFRINNGSNTDILFDVNPAGGIFSLGPLLGTSNIQVLDTLARISLVSTNIRIDNGLPVYVDNAAALVGGLVAGELYRDGDNVKIVH